MSQTVRRSTNSTVAASAVEELITIALPSFASVSCSFGLLTQMLHQSLVLTLLFTMFVVLLL
jgi:hypothetical protein